MPNTKNKPLAEKAMDLHLSNQGKLEVSGRVNLTPESLPLLYTPGVGEISKAIAEDKSKTPSLTMAGRTVAVVSDGSAVLGLGDVGPEAALPVMEGKALLFKELAGVDAVPIVIDAHDADGIVRTVEAIAPGFGGINLEDIAAPKCYEVEDRLQNKLSIPVIHDDQHATAIVVLAGLINAAKVTGKDLRKSKAVILGAGAAGSGITLLLKRYGLSSIKVFDSKGLITASRSDLDASKRRLVELTAETGTSSREQALTNCDILIGVSTGGTLSTSDVSVMAENPIVFALANPDPEILPGDAKAGGASVVATGRSDFPNQINNVLVFPGLFKGLLDSGRKKLDHATRVRIAETLAALVEKPTTDHIIPSVFDKRVVKSVSGCISD